MRLFGQFRRTRTQVQTGGRLSQSSAGPSSGPSSGVASGGVESGGAPPSTLWPLMRRFVRWLGNEKRRRRTQELREAASEQRKAERRARQAKAIQMHSTRREATERAQLEETHCRRFEERRALTEAQFVHEMLKDGPAAHQAKLRSAADGAARAQDERAQAAEAEPLSIKELRPGDDLWTKFGGPAVEAMLEDLDLIDARYLVELAEMGGIVPRWQEVPSSARIGRSNAWRLASAWHEYDCLAILVLSYAWLDKEHPDRLGEQLRRVAPVLRSMLSSVGSAHGTIGVMWDYCSLPQAPRTPEDEARFKRGLTKMNGWYMHPFTHVLQLASALPKGVDGDPYGNTRAWEDRGWCFFEGCASALVKHHNCLWDDRFYDVSRAGSAALAPNVTRSPSGLPIMPDSLDGLRQALRAGRPAPLSPSAFAETMRRRVESGSLAFTSSKADMTMVIELYASGFTAAFDTYPNISLGHNIVSFFGLQFGSDDEQVKNLVDTLTYVVKHCSFPHGPLRISCEGNGFSAASQQALREAVKGCSGIAELYVGYEPAATRATVHQCI